MHNALRDNCMENIIKFSFPRMTGQNDRQDESLTCQVHNEVGHCPLTGRYFQPCISLGVWFLSRGTDITYYSDCKASYQLEPHKVSVYLRGNLQIKGLQWHLINWRTSNFLWSGTECLSPSLPLLFINYHWLKKFSFIYLFFPLSAFVFLFVL